MWKRLLTIVITIALLLGITGAIGEQNSWNCPSCGRTGNTGNYCGSCGHPAPTSSSTPGQEIQIGQSIFFGRYPQTSSGNDDTPIEWLVLAQDESKALLISRYALDCKKYNDTHTNVTWETSTIREWLNGIFFNNAFSMTEQKAIQITTIDNSKKQGYYVTDGGNITQDYVFLLSYAEAWEYFEDNDARKCQPTEYVDIWTDKNGYVRWWLRSPGSSPSSATTVRTYGVRTSEVENTTVAVRPALWIDFSSINPDSVL